MRKETKVSLITGSSRGIGKAIALRLAQRGDIVLLNYKEDAEGIKILSNELKQKNATFEIFNTNVADFNEVEDMFNKIHKKYGKLDILINNAGVNCDKTLHKMLPDQWRKVISNDLDSVYNCTSQAIKLMREKNYGRVVTISSIVGVLGNFGQSNYAAAKSGIIGFTRSVAAENSSRNITVNAVCPGFIKTSMTDNIPENLLKNITQKIPIGRLGEPNEVADLVDFLTSDKANYISGQSIIIDGGLESRGILI